MSYRRFASVFALSALLATSASAAQMPVFDAHIHYSHDAVELTPPAEAIKLLRQAGLKRALVSSSGDNGTQQLLALAPDLIVPSLRPYRKRGELSTWIHDESTISFLEERLRNASYAAIGEFHVYGKDVDLPVPRRMVALAKQYHLVLHAHSDADAIERIFAQDPDARVIWAHSGFELPDDIAPMLRKHKNLWADLAYRTEHGSGGQVSEGWMALFKAFPDRIMIGTDTFTPERWYYVGEHANWSRQWLKLLPAEIAERIAWRNADALFANWKPKKVAAR